MNNVSIGGVINRPGWFNRSGLDSRKGNGGREISGSDTGWTRGLFMEREETQERSWFGWGSGEKMTPNSVLDKLSFRWLLDSQWELTIGSESVAQKSNPDWKYRWEAITQQVLSRMMGEDETLK